MTFRAMVFNEGQAVSNTALEFETIPRVGEYIALPGSTDETQAVVASVVHLPGMNGNTPSIRVNVRVTTAM